MNKVSGVYKITNIITGDFYIGSSKDVNRRWKEHKSSYNWKRRPNVKLYQAFQKYGLDKFQFQILVEIIPECLKQVEQDCIELMKPTYNQVYAKGMNVERHKATQKKFSQSKKRKEWLKSYRQSDKGRETYKRAKVKYNSSEKGKEYNRSYNQSEKRKEYNKAYSQSERFKEIQKKYECQPCLYNGEELTFGALRKRLRKIGVEHPCIEAKKYLIK